MKSIRCTLISCIAAGAALLVGCATTASTQNRENMLVASGFKVITPKTTAQKQKLQNLPPGKPIIFSQIQRITRLMSVDPSSTGITRSCAAQINLLRRTWKPPRYIRIQRWNGVSGAAGMQASVSGDLWGGRDHINDVTL